MINPPLSTTQVGVVPPQRSGMAAGSGNTFRQVGIATGIATLGAIFQHAVAAKTIDALGSAPGGSGNLSAALSSGNVRRRRCAPTGRPAPALRRRVPHRLYRRAERDPHDRGALAFLGAIAGFALVRRRDFVAAGAPAAGHQEGPRPLDEPAADAVRA